MADQIKLILEGSLDEIEEKIRQAISDYQFFKDKSFGTVYGIPAESYQELITFKPQVILYFQQPYQEKTPNIPLKRSQHGFRLIGKESQTITVADVEALAARIKTLFGGSTPFFYQTGKSRATYSDKSKGYQLKINCFDKINGKKIIEQILDINNHSPDWQFFNFIQNEEPNNRYDETPGSLIILGKSHKKPVRRRVAKVEFHQATLALHGKTEQILLYPSLIIP